MSRKKSRLLKSKAEAFRRNNAREHYIYSTLCDALASFINRVGATEAKVGYKNGEYYEEAISC